MSEDKTAGEPAPEEVAEENRRDEPVPSTHFRWAEAMVRNEIAGPALACHRVGLAPTGAASCLGTRRRG